MRTTSAWAARSACIRQWLVPLATVAWLVKFRTRSNVCCDATWLSANQPKTYAHIFRGTTMSSCENTWPASLFPWWRSTHHRDECRVQSMDYRYVVTER